jgi:hypothetical protein
MLCVPPLFGVFLYYECVFLHVVKRSSAAVLFLNDPSKQKAKNKRSAFFPLSSPLSFPTSMNTTVSSSVLKWRNHLDPVSSFSLLISLYCVFVRTQKMADEGERCRATHIYEGSRLISTVSVYYYHHSNKHWLFIVLFPLYCSLCRRCLYIYIYLYICGSYVYRRTSIYVSK